jgi:hypothetical protein
MNAISDTIHIWHDLSTVNTANDQSGRSWSVDLEVNGVCLPGHIIHEPREGTSQSDIYNYNLGVGETLRKYHQDKNKAVDPALLTLHQSVGLYAGQLLKALCTNNLELQTNSTECNIHVHELEPQSDRGLRHQMDHSIHRLHWEVLEGLDPTSLPPTLIPHRQEYRFRVHRHLDFPEDRLIEAPETLRSVQQDKKKCFNILLVIARDLSKLGSDEMSLDLIGSKSDISPDLAQWPLMQKRELLKHTVGPNRMFLDIVRPGSLEGLRAHLKRRFEQNPRVVFHLVHLDLHGFSTPRKSAKK